MEGCILSRGTPEEEQEVRNGNKKMNRIRRVGLSQCLAAFISSNDNISVVSHVMFATNTQHGAKRYLFFSFCSRFSLDLVLGSRSRFLFSSSTVSYI